MKIQQISIFLENSSGRLAEVTRVFKDGGVNLRAIMIADTADFGILRVIVDDPGKALKILTDAHFTTKTTDVLAVTVSDKVGSLADVLSLFEKNRINIEYLYAALDKVGETAVIIFKVENIADGLAVVEANGLSMPLSF
ncbi:amino acid-binding protein [Treponema zuelzerae]|uniref:Amino acid-binding protein n=1 Tax=Teretinema zuelzerae TaxID=156 RepID=A0AAE3JJI9_9SPIR|nr:ACT domain-containing protein [Teretinema zuelzerae]MBN2812133.1 amino acid-binding protein [Spirochaetales bacterium]MCD1655481.1 amino acid-binding protein [Teretinema zuelzerae]HPO02002.1 amino acid-binding protein [Treponemataceae bacterium]